MSLLKTKAITVGAILAYTGGDPEESGTFFHGPVADFSLVPGDVVKVVDVDRTREGDTPWAKVTVAVLKGKFCGRVGVVSVDMSLRCQRAWRHLTVSGSMEPVRVTTASGKRPAYRMPDAPTSGTVPAATPVLKLAKG